MNGMKKSVLLSVLFLWIFSIASSFASEADKDSRSSNFSSEIKFTEANVTSQQPLHASIVEVGEQICVSGNAFSNLKIQSFYSVTKFDFQLIKAEKGLRDSIQHSEFLLINLSASKIIFPFHYFW